MWELLHQRFPILPSWESLAANTGAVVENVSIIGFYFLSHGNYNSILLHLWKFLLFFIAFPVHFFFFLANLEYTQDRRTSLEFNAGITETFELEGGMLVIECLG